MDVRAYNRNAWDRQVAKGNRWTVPVSPDEIARARAGTPEVLLTPSKIVPAEWLGSLRNLDVLALASAGGQQAPLFAAAGARVVSADNSPAQLAQDTLVAEREGLELRTLQADMRDLSELDSASFDIVFNPVSCCFIPDTQRLWNECARVLRPGGRLLCGVFNPVLCLFPDFGEGQPPFQVENELPYSDLDHPALMQTLLEADEPVMFGHTLEALLGGILSSGLVMTGLFEDRDPAHAISRHTAGFIAIRAEKR